MFVFVFVFALQQSFGIAMLIKPFPISLFEIIATETSIIPLSLNDTGLDLDDEKSFQVKEIELFEKSNMNYLVELFASLFGSH
jgi:hypothetical protein